MLLGGLTAFTSLTIDLYLPALPRMATELHSSQAAVTLTLTASLTGLVIGQMIVGPLSDAIGRRQPMLFALALYVVASVGCALAPTVGLLVGARVIQALAGSANVVITRAIVRDRVGPNQLAATLASLMLVSGITPIVAPAAGGQLLRLTDWRGLFWLLAVVGGLAFVATVRWMQESLPAQRRHTGGIKQAGRSYASLVRDRAFVGYVLALGLSFAAIFTYVANSSFVYQHVFHFSPQSYGLLFAVNSIGLMAGAQSGGRLARRLRSRRLMFAGLTIGTAGAVAMTASSASMALGAAGVLAPLFIVILCHGVVAPNATALALARYPDSAGSASALLGMSQFGCGAVIAPLAGLVGRHGAAPMADVMSACMLAAITSAILLTRSERCSTTVLPDDAIGTLEINVTPDVR